MLNNFIGTYKYIYIVTDMWYFPSFNLFPVKCFCFFVFLIKSPTKGHLLRRRVSYKEEGRGQWKRRGLGEEEEGEEREGRENFKFFSVYLVLWNWVENNKNLLLSTTFCFFYSVNNKLYFNSRRKVLRDGLYNLSACYYWLYI